MNLEFNSGAQLKFNRFGKLGMWYVLALSVIATVAIVGQFLIQTHLDDQLSDSRVVNVAGRQRMLSQRITKCVLLLKPVQSTEGRQAVLKELKGAVDLWDMFHEGLQQGNDSLQLPGHNSEKVKAMFKEVNVHYESMRERASFVVSALTNDPLISYDTLFPAIETILLHERSFLDGMNQIVFQFDAEAKQKVSTLSQLEYALLIVSIVVILLEILFVFRPTTIQVNQTMNQLVASEKNAKKLSKEIGALYTSLEKSYEELSHVNLPTENPKLYAKTDRGGNVIFISDLFSELTGKEEVIPSTSLQALFPDADLDETWLDDIIDQLSEGNIWEGVVHYRGIGGKEHWVNVMIVPSYNEQADIDEWLVLGADITLQKQAEQNMVEKNKAAIEKKINQQKFRSVLILEGQEEERKRLAMDIHDGIGQMLTSLKFQIESIDTERKPEAIQEKLSDIQQLINQVIKEVRRVTFNLKPTVLSDYGLQAALNVFVKEIGKLSDIELTYKATGDASIRLTQKTENNIFRIIQEAINNAIKYSGATKIEVSLQQSDSFLVFTVQDNGKGFDEKLVEARSVNIDSGRGFFNMYERTEYVNGTLDVKSEPGQGTTIVLTVPVKSLMTVDQ